MLKLCCDWCGRPIDTVTDIIEETGEEYTHLDCGHPKSKEARLMYRVVCTTCADNIDKLLNEVENRAIDRERILERNRQLNEARRIKLGTKG